MRYLKKPLQYFISYPIYFFLHLIFPLFKIRFGRIYANRIGHLCFNTDNYLSIVSEKKNIITFFCYDEPVSNEIYFKYKKDEHHDEFELTGIDVADIEEMVKNAYIPYDHTVDKTDFKKKFSKKNRIYLTKINDNKLPNYLISNKNKYLNWFA